MLKLQGVTKTFGGLVAVNNVSFSVNKGEILGVIGPNGSGKTTLISMISGTLEVTEGDIFYKGESVSKLQPYQRARRGIARTFQIVKPLPNLTVKANIMTAALFGGSHMNPFQEVVHCLSVRCPREAFEKTQEIVEMAGLHGKEEELARNLTLPARKKLEVARALAMRPELLLLDEVMAGLNLKEVEETMEMIRHINRQGITVIMIEHIMKVIMGISNRIIVMNQGSLLCQGSPKEVSENPLVIEAYLGSRFVHNKKEVSGCVQSAAEN